MAYFRLLSSAFNGTTFPMLAEPTIVRDFTYVTDVTDILTRLVENATDVEEECAIINIGGGSPTSLKEMIDMVEEVTGNLVLRREVLDASALGDVTRTEASTEKLRDWMLPVPSTTLWQGIDRTAEWMQNVRSYAEAWVLSSK